MKRIKQQKKSGISLIVLVITIIVMIILAAAIILSLDGSDIIERAKGAQSSNDVATAKEIVALAKSEWSFERQEGYDTFREYAESKLEEAGYDMESTYVEDSGRVLFDTAARFAKAGVEIGTEVTGYTLNNTTTYTTSGKENTYNEDNEEEDTDSQPTILARDTNPTWTYIGIDKEGNALIAGSVTSTTPKMILGGKGGYVNGPAELDAACNAMYSSAKGTARSMNIDDVTKVLEYTGEKGAYYNASGTYTPTKEVKSIGQIAKEIGYNINKFETSTPETGKGIAAYKSDFFYINKISDVGEYNTGRVDLIYPTSTNEKLTSTYWLSSSCNYAYFTDESDCIYFAIRYIASSNVDKEYIFSSIGEPMEYRNAIRPVVVLASDVEVSYNGTIATLQ